MLPVSATMASILATSIRAPRLYVQFQIPVVTNTSLGTIDPAKLGALYTASNVLAFRRVSQYEPGADSVDISLNNQDGNLSALNNLASLGRFFYPGALDNKIQPFMGLANGASEALLPKGVFISESFNQSSQDGHNTASVSGLDQFSMFRGQVYAQFPPRLYGNQTGSYYNPNYALSNPSGDLKTYTCDAVQWMQASTDSKVWASDYVTVAVYSSAVSGGATAVPNSGATAYTINYTTGTVTFASAQPSNAVISVDARPLAMAPELMLRHLFVDFGAFDPNFLKLDTTGILLPVMENARDRSIIDIAKEIMVCTAPRGIRWMLSFDENGYIIFTEPAIDGPPVKVFTDEKDLLRITPEYGVRALQNVVRATARASNDQQLTAVAFDVQSISTFGQKPTYDIPSQLLSGVVGMDAGSAMNYMNGLVNSGLFELSTPTVAMEADVLPDYTLQVGDPVTIIEKKTGINKNFYIKQITEEISGSDAKQSLRLEQLKGTQDFMMGLPAAIGTPEAQNPNQINTQSGLIATITMQNGSGAVTTLVSGGAPALDAVLNPVIFNWTGGTLNYSISLATPPASTNTYIWRWMYIAEDAFVGSTRATGNGTAAGVYSGGNSASLAQVIASLFSNNRSYSMPYDVQNNADSTRSRRYYWPLLRCSDWVTNDGVTAYTTATTLTSSWTGGVGATNPYLYGNLRIAMSDNFGNTTSGFVGQALYATGTPAATTLGTASTTKLGVDFGAATSATIFAGIKRKVTPCFLGILVANTAGGIQFKRIPFNLTL